MNFVVQRCILLTRLLSMAFVHPMVAQLCMYGRMQMMAAVSVQTRYLIQRFVKASLCTRHHPQASACLPLTA